MNTTRDTTSVRRAGPPQASTAPSGNGATHAVASAGVLYLVPAPLDFGCELQAPLQNVMPLGTLAIAAGLEHWVCENAKSARAYLKRINEVRPLAHTLQTLQIQELPREVHKKGDHTGNFDAKFLLAPALQGHDMGLLSEAGMPAVADPGSSVVRAAHDLGIQVQPLVGPVSLLLTLAASGLNGQNFAFVGYLPQEATARVERIRELESLALKTGQTQLFIETPYRNVAMLQALLQTLQHNTRLAVCSGLTLASASCRSDSVKNWKRKSATADNATPAVFALGR
jgi:16S rRNA (cytidine1402-2'-O)-methyltransferase